MGGLGEPTLERALADAPEQASASVRALNIAAALSTLQQEHELAREQVDESLKLASALGDRAGEASPRLWLGFIGLTSEPPDAAELRRGLAIHEEVGDRLGICHSLVFLGAGLGEIVGSEAEGREALERAAELARALGDNWGEGFARSFLGWDALQAGDHELARSHLTFAVQAEALGPVRGTAIEAVARLALESGDPIRAIRLLGASAGLRERGGGRPPLWLRRRAQVVRQEAERRLDSAEAERGLEGGHGDEHRGGGRLRLPGGERTHRRLSTRTA